MRKRKGESGLVGLKELRENMGKYIKEVRKGRTFIVLRRSKSVFKIVPVDNI